MRDLDKIDRMIKENIATADEIWSEGADYILQVLGETGEYSTTVDTSEGMYQAFKWIMQNRQYLVVNGTIVDHFSGSAVWQVLQALKDESKRKLLSSSVTRIIEVTWKLINKTKQ